jgi:hypothetical protein
MISEQINELVKQKQAMFIIEHFNLHEQELNKLKENDINLFDGLHEQIKLE